MLAKMFYKNLDLVLMPSFFRAVSSFNFKCLKCMGKKIITKELLGFMLKALGGLYVDPNLRCGPNIGLILNKLATII